MQMVIFSAWRSVRVKMMHGVEVDGAQSAFLADFLVQEDCQDNADHQAAQDEQDHIHATPCVEPILSTNGAQVGAIEQAYEHVKRM